MSQQKVCPFCRRAIRGKDKYCPFCGRYVLEQTPPQNVYPTAPPPTYPPHMPPPTTTPYQTQPPVMPPTITTPPPSGVPPSPFASTPPTEEKPEELSEDVIDQIALRVELEQLDQTLTDIRAKLGELGEMVSKMDVTPEIENKIKNFKDKIKAIKAKREKLNAEKRDLPFEKDLLERKEIQERLKNLNEAYRSKEITESAFKKLRTEYEEKLQTIDDKSRSFKAKINTWIKRIKADQKKIQETTDLLDARHAAGELTKDEYEEKKQSANVKVKRYTNVLKYLSGKL